MSLSCVALHGPLRLGAVARPTLGSEGRDGDGLGIPRRRVGLAGARRHRVLAWAAPVAVGDYPLRSWWNPSGPSTRSDTLAILDRRYANGELTPTAYSAMRDDLTHPHERLACTETHTARDQGRKVARMAWTTGRWTGAVVAGLGLLGLVAAASAIHAATAPDRAQPAARASGSLPGAGGGYGYSMMGGYASGDGARGRYGMMGGSGNWGGAQGGYGMMGAYGAAAAQSVAMSKVAALGNLRPGGATVDPAQNRVVFAGKDVQLDVVASPKGQKDETFRIAGLVNPTVVVPTGATVHVTFVNADAGMYHDWVVTPAKAPFDYAAMMEAPLAFPAGATPMLGPATAATAEEVDSVFVAAAAGRYTYVCLWPGHAQNGMFGQFVVGAA